MIRIDERPVRPVARLALLWGPPLLATLLILGWARQLTAGYLAGALVAAAGAVLIIVRLRAASERGVSAILAALAFVAVTLTAGAFAQHRFSEIESHWTELANQRRQRLGAVLGRRMSSVVQRGRQAAAMAASAAAVDTARRSLFRELAALREQTGVDALVVFNAAGDLQAWAGEHRGELPDEVRAGGTDAFFTERPLYSYLYLSAPVRGSAWHAVAAVLVETGLVMPSGQASVTDTFAARTDIRASFRAGAGRGPGVVWSLTEGADTVVHAQFAVASQEEMRTAVEIVVRRVAVFCGLVALVLLAIGWLRAVAPLRIRRATALPLLAGIVALTVAPLGPVLAAKELFSPALFVLPAPGDATLGMLLAVLIPIAALTATSRTPLLASRGFGLSLGIGAAAVAIAFPAAIRLLLNGATPELLDGGNALWFGLQVAAVMLLATITALGMPRQPAEPPGGTAPDRRRLLAAVFGGLVLATALGLLVMVLPDPRRPPTAWLEAFWAVPFVLVSIALARVVGRSGRLARWLVAGWLAATAVLPHLWNAHVHAQLASAEREIATLGTNSSGILDFLLVRFGRVAQQRYAAGEDGMQLLYRSWVASGLAREPTGANITLWSRTGSPELELGLGGAEPSASEDALVWPVVQQVLQSGGWKISVPTGVPTITKVYAAALDRDHLISVSVPPRRTLERHGIIAPFLGAPPSSDAQVSLVGVRSTVPASSTIHWEPSARGWRSEAVIDFPDGAYHAHVDVAVTPTGIRLARAVLVVAVDLFVLLLLWILGSAARGAAPLPLGRWTAWIGSFRARITLALFGFFLLPTIVFGWVAYGALSGVVERAARTIAERAVRQAVIEFPQRTTDLRELAEQAGTDVLYYLGGELTEESSPEALQLGIYNAWMPPDVFLDLESGEEAAAVKANRVGGQSFLIAYHVAGAAGVLAVPTSLSAGDTAIRQRELADLILFSVLVGALLSLALSVAVGRALAGPIGRLKRAAAAVGGGQLRVQLPEPEGDEFGELFASFNRMVRRLRRARAQEIRTARVLAWGEMARQIAHEIKNPLTPIKLSVQHLRRAYADGRSDFARLLEVSVDQILVEIDRLTEIARAFSRYGAPSENAGPLARVDVAAVVHEALTLYRTGDSGVVYVEDIEATLPDAEARAGELKEVILNLLENARTALNGSGTVAVHAARAGAHIELLVMDDGPGIPPTLLARVFDPHFSTRSTGTGLGLAIVRRLVESWGGAVQAESEPGQGTRVRVLIPAIDRPDLRALDR